MAIFNKKQCVAELEKDRDETIEHNVEKPEANWIWVEGYKGFNSDLTCNGMQYEIGENYTYDGDVALCNSGYHFCLNLSDVFKYYSFDFTSKFCKVKALVKESDYSKCIIGYKEYIDVYASSWYVNLDEDDKGVYTFKKEDKLTSKEITIISEASIKEIYDAYNEKSIQFDYINNIEDFEKAYDIGYDSFKRHLISENLSDIDTFSDAYKLLLTERIMGKMDPHINFNFNYLMKEIRGLVSMNMSTDMLVYMVENIFNARRSNEF